MPTVRAKFNVVSKTQYPDGYGIVLQPVTATNPENAAFFKWTPSGEFKMQVLNPDAAAQFEVGKAYYIDFTPADPPASAPE